MPRITSVSLPSEDEVWLAVSYNPESGEFTRRKSGARAGSRTKAGYVELRINGCRVYAHRLAWFMTYGEWPESTIDHIDGDPANNRIANLRDVSQAVNRANTYRSKGRSGLVGVSWHKGSRKWVARITPPHGKQRHLGVYTTPEEAQQAYNKAKAEFRASLAGAGYEIS